MYVSNQVPIELFSYAILGLAQIVPATKTLPYPCTEIN